MNNVVKHRISGCELNRMHACWIITWHVQAENVLGQVKKCLTTTWKTKHKQKLGNHRPLTNSHIWASL